MIESEENVLDRRSDSITCDRLLNLGSRFILQDAGIPGPFFGRIGKGKDVYYDIELLRCSQGTNGLVCCAEDAYPCKEPDLPELPSQQ